MDGEEDKCDHFLDYDALLADLDQKSDVKQKSDVESDGYFLVS